MTCRTIDSRKGPPFLLSMVELTRTKLGWNHSYGHQETRRPPRAPALGAPKMQLTKRKAPKSQVSYTPRSYYRRRDGGRRVGKGQQKQVLPRALKCLEPFLGQLVYCRWIVVLLFLNFFIPLLDS